MVTIQLPGLRRDARVGLGDAASWATRSIGIKPCAPCRDRAERLNRLALFSGRAGADTLPEPRPGCWFAGTKCRGFFQSIKFCCGDGTEYTERWGWCVGFWDFLPCRPGAARTRRLQGGG